MSRSFCPTHHSPAFRSCIEFIVCDVDPNWRGFANQIIAPRAEHKADLLACISLTVRSIQKAFVALVEVTSRTITMKLPHGMVAVPMGLPLDAVDPCTPTLLVSVLSPSGSTEVGRGRIVGG